MTRLVWDNGLLWPFADGDGPGGTDTGIGSADSAENGGRAIIWSADSSEGTTEENGTFAPGDKVKLRSHEFIGRKVHEGEYLGTYEAPHGVTYLVVHSETSYGGTFFLIGPEATNAQESAMSTDFNMESDIKEESYVVCFLPGTLIATPSGERRVENLVPGDLILVDDSDDIQATRVKPMRRWLRRKLGLKRAIPVKWIGRKTVSTRFGPTQRLMPVRFAAGSLGGGGLLPHSDLTVTADHAMLVDGVLCEAGALVNGTSITRVPLSELGESYTVYHVETDAHEILLANGASSETFIDNVSRRAFDNYAEFEELYGEQPEMRELPHPRASNPRHLPARIKNRLGITACPGKVA